MSQQVWVQLARWTLDKEHVELVGRQTEIKCPLNTNIDGLVRRMIHDDAYRDETQSIGVAKLRVFKSISNNLSLNRPIDELEPFVLVQGLGMDGQCPLIVVAPMKNYPVDFQYPLQYPLMNADFVEFPFQQPQQPRKRKDLSIEEKRNIDKLRQRNYRARKKVFLDLCSK